MRESAPRRTECGLLGSNTGPTETDPTPSGSEAVLQKNHGFDACFGCQLSKRGLEGWRTALCNLLEAKWLLGVSNLSPAINPDFLDFSILKITCTPNTLFSKGYKLLQILETRILGSFEPGSEKGPSINRCKSSKRGFLHTKIQDYISFELPAQRAAL